MKVANLEPLSRIASNLAGLCLITQGNSYILEKCQVLWGLLGMSEKLYFCWKITTVYILLNSTGNQCSTVSYIIDKFSMEMSHMCGIVISELKNVGIFLDSNMTQKMGQKFTFFVNFVSSWAPFYTTHHQNWH